MLFSQCSLHTLQMVNLNVFAEIFLIQSWHVKNLKEVPPHVDEGFLNQLFCFWLTDFEGLHHLGNCPVSLFFYEQIIQNAQYLTQRKEQTMWHHAGYLAHEHQNIVNHVYPP